MPAHFVSPAQYAIDKTFIVFFFISEPQSTTTGMFMSVL